MKKNQLGSLPVNLQPLQSEYISKLSISSVVSSHLQAFNMGTAIIIKGYKESCRWELKGRESFSIVGPSSEEGSDQRRGKREPFGLLFLEGIAGVFFFFFFFFSFSSFLDQYLCQDLLLGFRPTMGGRWIYIYIWSPSGVGVSRRKYSGSGQIQIKRF